MNTVEKGKAFLEHYGVKGMRWGVRRSDKQLKKAAKEGDSGGASKPKTVVGKTKTSGKTASELSDKNLQKVINRMNMEQQHAKLTAPPPSVARKVTKFVSEVGVNVARTQLTNLANDQASKKIAAVLAKKAAKAAT